MKIFEYTLTVTENDIDALNHVNNVRYVDWINEAAKQHWQLKASHHFIENFYWVVLNHNINYKSAAFLGDKLVIKTFITLSDGAKSHRIVEIYKQKEHKLLVQAETIWCMIDAKTHKPNRIPEDIINLFA